MTTLHFTNTHRVELNKKNLGQLEQEEEPEQDQEVTSPDVSSVKLVANVEICMS